MPLTKATTSSGFALIETLVTIVVVALGMLGILAILMQSFKLTTSSNYRTIAAMQTQAMAEKLRANPTALFTAVNPSTGQPLTSVNPANGLATINPTFTTPGSQDDYSATTNCLKSGTTCSVGSFVATSIAIWNEQLAQILPKGQGTVCQDDSAFDHTPNLSVSPIDWNCSNGSGTAPVAIKVCWNETRVVASRDSLGAGGWLCVAEAL